MADKSAHEKETKYNEEADLNKIVLKPAKICTSCGASLTGTNEKCIYCGAIIPENVLYNKEKELYNQQIMYAQRMRELQQYEQEREAAHKRVMEIKKEERKSEFFPFLIAICGVILLFVMAIVFKK